MRYETPEAFRRAIQDRIRRQVQESGVSDARLRKLVVFERFFARLNAVAPDRWWLKGALALDLRFGRGARATMDADIALHGALTEPAWLILRASQVDLSDFFTFEVRRAGEPRGDSPERSARFHIRSFLAGRVFDEAILDVVIGARLPPDLERITFDMLRFAGLQPVEVRAAPVEEQVAEKVHAYTRVYRGGWSTRVKDLVDLVVTARACHVSGERLRAALAEVFSRRQTHEMPAELPRPPATWAVAYRRSAAAVSIDPDLETGWRAAAAFLNPILSGKVTSGTWDPALQTWT